MFICEIKKILLRQEQISSISYKRTVCGYGVEWQKPVKINSHKLTTIKYDKLSQLQKKSHIMKIEFY